MRGDDLRDGRGESSPPALLIFGIALAVVVCVGVIAWAALNLSAGTANEAVEVSAQRADAWVKATDQQAAPANVNLGEVARRACPEGQRLVNWQPTQVNGTTVGVAGRCEPGPALAWFSVVDHHSASKDARVAALLNSICPDGRVDTWQPVLRSGTTVGALGVCQPGG